MAKSWTEKLNDRRPHQGSKPAPIDIAGMKAGEIMLVPTPRLIDALIRAIPEAAAAWMCGALRRELARRHERRGDLPDHHRLPPARRRRGGVGGASARTPAVAEITPFWRVLDGRAPTAAKLSFGDAFLAQQRRLEGLA